MTPEVYTRLLQRQVRKYVPEELLPVLAPFLERVNDSYSHYEQDRQLISRSIELSSHELQEANDQLRKSNESLESFNYAAAHDLKNHAINIQGMILMLKKYRHSDPVKEDQAWHYLDRSLLEFMKTVQGFLHVSKVQALLDRDPVMVPFSRVKELVELDCKHLIDRKDASLQWHQQGMECDHHEELMRSLLVNLISNSIKYSRQGVRPLVEVRFHRSPSRSELTVKDNGMGIDLKKNGKSLFVLFSRLKRTNGEEGTGVGLYLVKKLVENRSGKLRVESEPGQGTTITIELPEHAAN